MLLVLLEAGCFSYQVGSRQLIARLDLSMDYLVHIVCYVYVYSVFVLGGWIYQPVVDGGLSHVF